MKICISGAGVAGPTLAYWLERSGHKPVLVEHAADFRAGGYVIDFWGTGYTIAERMGVLEDVRARGYSIEEVRFVDADGTKAAAFSAKVFGRMTGGRYTSLPRGDLAECIYMAVQDKVETVFGDSISAIDMGDEGVAVRFESGARRDFDLVIGADGLHSNVRRLLFGPEVDYERKLGFYVAAFEVSGYTPRDENVYLSHAVPGRTIFRFALRGGTTLFLFVFEAGRMTGPEPHAMAGRKAALRDIFSDMKWECPDILGVMEDADDIYFDRVSQIEMPAWSKSRAMLVGDAAACVSLLAGEGTGLAMTQAYVLAGELQRAGGDHRAAFAAHEARLRPFLLAKQKSARAFASSFAPKTALGIGVRNLVTNLLRVPFVANLAIGPSLKDDFDLPDYRL
ncbi:FAD-binding domain [Hyphomonas johnsonii]|uniref:FAD-binding domain-containing protein n=1 Tax=Hyphomonas johnsonii MHS-2 TaxID=1280950 RepID=A0A059FQI9_9PROT|nr:FAD-binding domain [Hyphomonas johnsonii]KCZ92723.1 hypothetical protein HJO_07207 [Hyphomonas johnsonii MHS-2]